ncbi:MAG: GWxTD domain-containing protein [Candidatus Aminicenantes bacterium]|nr:MAG: GWxTD domain-containing protein [Candidatus Aminicenantes bacterium]
MKTRTDPYYKDFFEKARLIMTKEEIDIYKVLPDEESRREFIEDFWKIRDPSPGSEENEAKIEFEERIKFANRWFWPLSRARRPDDEPDNDAGWNTDQGRMYIILGPPDFVSIDGVPYMFWEIQDRWRFYRGTEEVWWYDRYQLALSFRMSRTGILRLVSYSTGFASILEEAKLNLLAQGFIEDRGRRFRFEAKFDDNEILIMIPVKRVSFKDEDESLNAKFRIKINVYHNHKKVDEIEETKSYKESEDELIQTKQIIFKLPFEPSLKGKYYLDIVVEDLMALYFSVYRNYVRHKH